MVLFGASDLIHFGSVFSERVHALLGMDFQDLKFYNYNKKYWDESKPRSVGFILANRIIHCNNEIYNLIAVVIRGTAYTEWYDNFNILKNPRIFEEDMHAGFSKSAGDVLYSLNDYAKSINGLDVKSTILNKK